MTLKGVQVEETPDRSVDSAQVLQMYRDKKTAAQDKGSDWDDLDTEWNPDGTLSRLTTYKNGDIFYQKNFAWNADGTLSRIIRK